MPMCRDDIKSEKFLKLNEWVRNKRIMIDVTSEIYEHIITGLKNNPNEISSDAIKMSSIGTHCSHRTQLVSI